MIDFRTLTALSASPRSPIRSRVFGRDCRISVVIPDYARNIVDWYGLDGQDNLAAVCERAETPMPFAHFGLLVDFDAPAALDLHDAELVVADWLRAAIDRFGPILFRNAGLGAAARHDGQRNIFPDLRFHFDRGPGQPNQHSLYTRDGADAIQCAPRISSTLFIANVVAFLQAAREEGADPIARRGMQANYEIFTCGRAEAALGKVVLEQRWDAPRGTSETAVIDNRTVLHASYYRTREGAGYPIGTRYLY